MNLKPGYIVVVIQDHGEIHRNSIYQLTSGNNGDDDVPVQGYELRRDLKPTGTRNNLTPKYLAMYDRGQQIELIKEMRATIAKKDRELATREEALSRYKSDFDEMAEDIDTIIKSNADPGLRTKAIAEFLEKKARSI